MKIPARNIVNKRPAKHKLIILYIIYIYLYS